MAPHPPCSYMRPQLWQLYTLAPNAQTALLNRGICLIKAPARMSLADSAFQNCFVYAVLWAGCDGFVFKGNSKECRSMMGA